MKIIKTATELSSHYGSAFVPTMGALHAGHASLIKIAMTTARPVVVSIFVNPTQFAANEDLAKYPRTLEADLDMCLALGVSAVFVPDVDEIYPPLAHLQEIEPGPLGHVLEGQIRPTHFKGVLTVVNRLFDLVKPQLAVFGKKDRQQLVLIKKMVRELAIPIEILEGETARDTDGLALSSRNRYLSAHARREALRLPQALISGVRIAEEGASLDDIKKKVLEQLGEADYLEITDSALNPIDPSYRGSAIILGAIRVEGVRLIDNMDLVLR